MPGRLPSSAGGFHSPTLSRSRNAGYGSTTMSARGRRPNQAGIAALARSTAARAASSIAALERRLEQRVQLAEGDANVPPRRAEPQAEARSLIVLLGREVARNGAPPRQRLPPRRLRPHGLQ